MPKYIYTAVDEHGKKIKGCIEAENRSEFNLILKRKKEYLLSYRDANEKMFLRSRFQIPKKELFFFCRQFSAMLSSGVNAVKCLEILYNQTKHKKVKAVLYQVYQQLQTGKTLSEAMESMDGAFPDFMINMIKAGEMSGNLEEAIKRLAIQYEKDIKITNKVISAMVYPMFLLIASIASIIVMFGVVLPKIMDMLGNIEDLNVFSRALFSIAQFVTKHWLVCIIVGLVSLLVLLIYIQTDMFKKQFSKLKVKMPIIGKLYITMISGIFTRTLSTLFLSGITLIDAIKMSSKVINNSYIDEIFDTVIDDITNGLSFSDAMLKANIFPYNVTSIISVGEETGSLQEILAESSDYYDMVAEDAIQKMSSIIEPVMIILFGIIVLIILAGAFLPIYTMYNNIGTI